MLPVPTMWISLQPERPPQDAGKPVDSNELCKCSHSNAACTEAELLPQVRNLIQDPERVALAAAPYAGHPDQSAGPKKNTKFAKLWPANETDHGQIMAIMSECRNELSDMV